jgi:hypothetical protein
LKNGESVISDGTELSRAVEPYSKKMQFPVNYSKLQSTFTSRHSQKRHHLWRSTSGATSALLQFRNSAALEREGVPERIKYSGQKDLNHRSASVFPKLAALARWCSPSLFPPVCQESTPLLAGLWHFSLSVRLRYLIPQRPICSLPSGFPSRQFLSYVQLNLHCYLIFLSIFLSKKRTEMYVFCGAKKL